MAQLLTANFLQKSIALVCMTMLNIFFVAVASTGSEIQHRGNFLIACHNDDYKGASVALEKDPGIVRVRQEGGFMVHYAIDKGSYAITDLLLRSNADIHARDRFGRSPLHAAVIAGRSDIVSLLLSRKANVAAIDVQKQTPLHMAMEPHHDMQCRGDVNIARMLIEHKASLSAVDHRWYTPLHSAALENDESMVALLLRYGADVTIQDSQLLTPLQRRFKQDHGVPHEAMVQLLAAAGDSDPYHMHERNPFNVDGCLACAWIPTISNARADMALVRKRLNDQLGKSLSMLLPSVREIILGYCTPLDCFIKEVLAKSSSLPQKALAADEVKILFDACRNNNLLSAMVMLEKNPALVHAHNREAGTPLVVAAQHDAEYIAKLLVRNRADVHARNNRDATALRCAAGRGNKKIVSLLLSRGADCNAKDLNGATPLHYVAGSWPYEAKQSHVDVARILMASKASLEEHDYYGYTPLHNAIHTVRPAMAALLLCRNADPSLKNNEGIAPAHLVFQPRSMKHPIRAKLCIAAGATVVPQENHTFSCGITHDNQPISPCDRCAQDTMIATVHAELKETEKEVSQYLWHCLAQELSVVPHFVRHVIAGYCTVDHLLLPHLARQVFAQPVPSAEVSSSQSKRQKQQ